VKASIGGCLDPREKYAFLGPKVFKKDSRALR
jgi:hypothetical protein